MHFESRRSKWLFDDDVIYEPLKVREIDDNPVLVSVLLPKDLVKQAQEKGIDFNDLFKFALEMELAEDDE